jgi:hypothetical protein
VEATLRFDTHPTEDILEEYIFNRLLDEAKAALEEHLLLCSKCREALQDSEEYIRLMKAATADDTAKASAISQIRAVAMGPPLASSVVWAAGLVMLCAMALLSWRVEPPPPPAAVLLSSLRGGEGPSSMIRGPAGRPLDLDMNTDDVPVAANRYRLEMVNAAGRPVWDGMAPVSGGKLTAHVSERLKPGVYWVRLRSAEGELLREFGLRLD